MYFRAQRKLQGEVSLTETLEAAGDGGTLSLMDVIAVDDNMLEDLDTRDACVKVRRCVQTCLTPRERLIITLRYGLDDTAGNCRPVRHQSVLCIPHREEGAGKAAGWNGGVDAVEGGAGRKICRKSIKILERFQKNCSKYTGQTVSKKKRTCFLGEDVI